MKRETARLTKLQLSSSFGINEARYSNDKAKRRRLKLLLGVYAFVLIIVVVYVLAYSLALAFYGMAKDIPVLLFGVTNIIVLFFTMFKAGDVIFNVRSYERLAALPLRPSSIVASRFLSMYALDALLCALVMLPGFAVYAAFERPEALSYVFFALLLVFLPLLPMTAASLLGVLIHAVSARMKHRNLVVILLSLVFTLAVVILPLSLSFSAGELSAELLLKAVSSVKDFITTYYPPAALYSDAVTSVSFASLLLLTVLSLAVFFLFVLIVSKSYARICSALSASVSSSGYRLEKNLSCASPLRAMYKKELKRYLTTSIYFMNTSIGYILMVIGSIALVVVGPDKLESALKTVGLAKGALPFALSIICMISPPSACAVSLEGKQWPLLKSLPISTKTVLDSKLLLSFTVALPCYIISEAILLCTLPLTLAEAAVFVLVPLAAIILSVVLGLLINIKMPLFDWDSETTVVKQSGATGITLLLGFLLAGSGIVLSIAVPAAFASAAAFIWSAAALVIALILYRYLISLDLRRVN